MNITVQPAAVYNLNEDQKNAADAFLNFLFDPTSKEFIISGPAGVGKTYLMNYIIDNIMPRYEEMCRMIGVKSGFTEVVMTATTNKAAEVLSRACKRPTSTIHSLLGLVVAPDFTTGGTYLRRKKDWRPHHNKIVVIDECSMVDIQLWKEVNEATVNCKIIWVGDRHQLAPVGEDLSPVYKHASPMVELMKPVRNADQPALLNVCSQLRETVATGVFKPIQVVPGVIDLLDNRSMPAEIEKHFKEQTHASRILAYTNKRVIQYNDHIRQLRNLPSSFTVGEFLVTASMYHGRKGQIPVEQEIEVLRNHGPAKVMFDEDYNVEVDVEHLDIQDAFGDQYFNVPVPTNRDHHAELKKWYGQQKLYQKKNQLQDNFADLRPRDAATVHKSQGSTYDSVFIDLGNISTCNMTNQVARMLYVAFSRARSRVFLYGDLAQKYGGLAL